MRSGTYITQVSKETVVRDTELLALQERESKLRPELDRSRGEMERSACVDVCVRHTCVLVLALKGHLSTSYSSSSTYVNMAHFYVF